MSVSTKGRRRRVPRAQREREMVAAARAAFAERGFADASMDDIATACGITKPMLYAYFGSKEGLFEACARQAAEELLDECAGADVAQTFTAVFDFVERNRQEKPILDSAEVRNAMAQLLGELIEGEPLGHALTGATMALVDWWLEHPGEPKELQAERLMNIATVAASSEAWRAPQP